MKKTTDYWVMKDTLKIYEVVETPEEKNEDKTIAFKKMIQSSKKIKEYVELWDMLDPKQK